MIYILYTIHVLICLFLILVVLLQQGSGADLSVFGGGGTQTAFGARSATNLLHKLTVGGFIAFILTTIAIGFMKTGGSGSVMSDVEQTAGAQASETTAPGEVDETAGETETALPDTAPSDEVLGDEGEGGFSEEPTQGRESDGS